MTPARSEAVQPTIGVFAYMLAGAWEGQVLSGIVDAVSRAGGRTVAIKMVCAGGTEIPDFRPNLSRVGWDRMGAFISFPNSSSPEYLSALQLAGKPVVVISNQMPGLSCPTVFADNSDGVRQAIEHLLRHGHTDIAFVGSLEEFDVRERYDAYIDTLRAHGIEPRPELFFAADNNFEHGAFAAAERMLAAGLPSTAVIAGTDLNAVAIMKTLKEAGRVLPRDQAIVGFDDNPDAALLSPSLTTVSQNAVQLGAKAAELALRQLAGEEVAPGRYTVPTSLVVRASCGCEAGDSGTDEGPKSSCADDGEKQASVAARQDQLPVTLAMLASHKINEECYMLRDAIRSQYRIVLDLLNSGDPHSVAWLAATDARTGGLALWRDAGKQAGQPDTANGDRPTEALDLVSTFDITGKLRAAIAPTTYPHTLFPPEELLSAPGDGHLTCMFPIQNTQQNWGFLVITLDSTARLTHEGYFMWSDLLANVLDHRALLVSWRQRSDELARVYEREREMAEAVQLSEERYALAAKAANDGLWDWDVLGDKVYFSSRWKEMLGYSEDDIDNGPEQWLDRVHPEDRPALLADLAAMKTGDRQSLLNEHRIRTGDGSYVWVLCRGLAVPGIGLPATRLVGSLTDITERRALEEFLRQQALYDSLTGLANRKLFVDRLSAVLAGTKEDSAPTCTVLWLDLDNFKGLNDTLGHVYGDMLLTQVADRIRAHVRRTDTAARFGGDEFALLIEGVDEDSHLDEILGRLSDHLNEPYDLDGHRVVVTASIGVVRGATGYRSPEEVMRDADTAMYQAKSKRRGSYVKFAGSIRRGRGRQSRVAPTTVLT
jgi:diguanylate cyclase (GGDEF)-like protein/PAS domain S-box-containing protein